MLMEFQTKLLHGKAVDNYANGSTVPPISLANAFAYESSEQLEKVFQNRAPGFAYTRIANPTVDAFERRVNELEGGIGGVACSSGMSAVTLSLLNILQAGDEVIAGSALFGGTLDLLHDLEAFGIKVHFIPRVEKALIEPFLTDKTRAVFGEIVGNPALNVMDVRETADFLHGKGVPLIVDSTTSTPYLLNPIQYGADVVVHSTSKYINGSGDAISGIIIDSGNFSWSPERYPGMKEYKKYGKFAYDTRFSISVAKSCYELHENAPDNMLAFWIDGYVYVRRICEESKITENGVWSKWSPYPGITVETTITPDAGGHTRVHKITSEIDCVAYDCGFAVSRGDFEEVGFAEKVDGMSAQASNEFCSCTVSAVLDENTQVNEVADKPPVGYMITVDPNTNLLYTKTKIPAVKYHIRKGSQEIVTRVDAEVI